MIAIPQEEYMQMTAVQQAHQPLTQQFQNSEKQFTDAEQIRDPYRRMILQGEALEDMKELKEVMRNNVQITSPKPYKNRAKALYQSVESVLRFNEKGELIDKNNQNISQSRVEDLIQHAVRDRRRNMTPIGWSTFLEILREHNIPKSSLNRQTLDDLEASIKMPKSAQVEVKTEPSSTRKRKKLTPVRKSSRKVKKPDFLAGYEE